MSRSLDGIDGEGKQRRNICLDANTNHGKSLNPPVGRAKVLSFESHLDGRRESFVNVFSTIARRHHQIVSALGFTIQHSSGVNGAIGYDLEVFVVCGYAVLDATVIACEKEAKEPKRINNCWKINVIQARAREMRAKKSQKESV